MTTTRGSTTPATTRPGATRGRVELVKAPLAAVTTRHTTTVATPGDATIAATTTRGWRARQWLRARRIATATRPVATLTTAARANSATAAARLVARHAWMVGRGVVSWVERAVRGATHGYHREQIRLARAAGSSEQLEKWANLLREERNDRIDRLAQLPKVVIGMLFAAAIALGIAFAVVLACAIIALAIDGSAGWHAWWSGVGATVVAIRDVAVVVWRLATALALPVAVVLAWREGRRRYDPPLWLLAPEQRRLADSEITPSKLVIALRDLGIAELRKALKDADDAGGGMLSPIVIAGCGVQVDVTLPSGVSTDQVQAKRRRLAENLDRHEHELFITLAPQARTVRLWIADPGALDEPIGPSPLVLDPGLKADAQSGRAPWGQSLRGDPVALSLWQRHLLITGLSNQGKTYALRALALWLALDTRTELRIADLKGVGDWAMFDGLATELIEGPADEHVIRATHMLEAAVEEMHRRLMSGHTDWPMLVLIVDEAQKAYLCPAVGPDRRPYGGKKNTSRFFMAVREIQNQGRAVNVIFWQGTQDPTDQNLPKLVREGAHIRASLVVGTEEQARMALGDKAIDGGAAPHLLRQGLDKGTLVVAGDGVELPPGEPSITVRTHFIDDEAAASIAARAKERRRKAGRLVQTSTGAAEQVDHLADIHAAMRGERRVRTAVILGRLIEQDEQVYTAWGFDDLAAAVREYAHLGLDVRKSDGQSVLRLEEVERALRERE